MSKPSTSTDTVPADNPQQSPLLDLEEAAASLDEQRKATTPDPKVPYNAAVLSLYRSTQGDALDAFALETACLILGKSKEGTNVEQELEAVAKEQVMTQAMEKVGLVPLYNLAVVAYRKGSLEVAKIIVLFLYGHVEPMDEWLALRTCFLVMDVEFRLGNLESVAKVVAYLVRAFPALKPGGDHVSDVERILSTRNAFPAVAPAWEERNPATVGPVDSMAHAKQALKLYCWQLRAEAGDTQPLRAMSDVNAVIGDDEDGSMPGVASLISLAKRETSSRSALRHLLDAAFHPSDTIKGATRPFVLNNIGVVHNKLGYHALAAQYFEQARQAVTDLLAAHPEASVSSEVLFGKDTKMAYNLGVQYLSLGKFKEALALFSLVARKSDTLSRSPCLWIRMAECCIGAATSRACLPLQRTIGQGRCRRIVITPPFAPPSDVLHYGAVCARAALSLLDPQNSSSQVENRSPDSGVGSRAAEQSAAKVKKYRAAALCLLAFCLLHFDDAETVAVCDELISMDDEERATLGRLYAAEALCNLGKSKAAIDRLAPVLAIREEGKGPREAAFVSVALARIMEGDIAAGARAAKVAIKATSSITPEISPRRETLLLAAYLSLREGDTEGGKFFLRMGREQ